MDGIEQFNTAELLEVRPQLRDDLRLSFRTSGGKMLCMVEDPINSAFYQIGMNEYRLVSLMDGQTAISEAISLTSAELGADAFDENEALSIVRWLFQFRLVRTPDSVLPTRLAESAEESFDQERLQKLNPLMTRVPLFNPSSLLDRLTPALSWLFSWPVAIAWCLLILVALKTVFVHGSEIWSSAGRLVDRNNWAWLLVGMIVLKLLHELAHGIACRMFGGNVRESGVVLILFAPIPYVDVTSAWKFPSRWQRIIVSLAGMLAEFAIAAAAILVWASSRDPVVQQHALNIAMLGSVTSVLFNGNFLMRFDGYYVLSDWLGIPNLGSLGKQYTDYLGNRHLLGLDVNPPRWPASQVWIIKAYGIAAWLWKLVVLLGITMAASYLFFGFGLIFSLVGIGLWLGIPLVKLIRFLIFGQRGQRANLGRVTILTASCAALVVASFTIIPWPFSTTAPLIVDFSEAEVVRSQGPGFVKQLLVSQGDSVEPGQLLVVLENRQQVSQLAQLRLELQQSRLAGRRFHRQGLIPAYQAEVFHQKSLSQQIETLQRKVEALRICSTRSGQVLGRNLQSLKGKWLSEGSELFRIGDSSQKKLVLSIHQDDIEQFQNRSGHDARVVMESGSSFSVPLPQPDPGASDEIRYAALAATVGGPVPVQSVANRVKSATANQANSRRSDTQWRFASPRFSSEISLSREQSLKVSSGLTGTLEIETRQTTFGGRLWQLTRNWLSP